MSSDVVSREEFDKLERAFVEFKSRFFFVEDIITDIDQLKSRQSSLEGYCKRRFDVIHENVATLYDNLIEVDN